MLVWRLKVIAASVGALVVLLAVVIYLGSSRVAYDLVRSDIASQELETYLKLSELVYRHFHLESDVLLGREADSGLKASRDQLAATIDQLNELSKQETLIIEDPVEEAEEAEEFLRAARIDSEVQRAYVELVRIRRMIEGGDRAGARQALIVLRRERIEGSIKAAIADAIEDEAGEVMRADAEAQDILSTLALVAQVTAVCIVGLTALLFFVFTKRVGRPIGQLVEAVKQVGDGRLSHRLAVEGKTELAQLAEQFNAMLAKLEAREAELRSSRALLEAKVEERTHELDAANKALQRTDQIRQKFLADISHELRTPITVIQGEAEIALRGKEKDTHEYKQSLQHIVDSALQLGRLVGDLLFVARTAEGEGRINLQSVELTDLLESIKDEGQHLGKHKEVSIALCQVEGEATVLGDRQRLRQLFFILIENAIRYSGEEVKLALDITRPDGWVRTRVCDDGFGMSKSEITNAFNRFYRGGGARQFFPEGSGLGLPLAKSIVEAHQGRIAIESDPGRGTTVTIDLPASETVRPAA